MASFCGVRPNPCSGKQLEERSKDAPSLPPHAEVVKGFFVHNLGMQEALKLEAAERGHVAFSLTVIPQLTVSSFVLSRRSIRFSSSSCLFGF
ncbi:unnamed protein product [Spirodela intermedia]|uniref:Uncharacterized protein n=1 Tax=Spirodela intermedia TaxID=51605 RepID=A0A7I8IZD6_SPIIN|nr:unnamed protein product [Spirodela intermedia]CAA6663355.1 unnamed protein product [Spirodela intermedia]